MYLRVDDSRDDAWMMARALRRDGMIAECVRVDTLDAVAALADDRGWDVVLCDHIMPRVDAARVLDTVHRTLPQVPIVLVCGYYPSELWHELGSGLVSEFLSKKPDCGFGKIDPHDFERVARRRSQRIS